MTRIVMDPAELSQRRTLNPADLEPDQAARALAESQSPEERLKQMAKDYGTTAGKVGAATADLIFGAPAQLVGSGMAAMTRARLLGHGESRETQDAGARVAKEMIPAWAATPVQSLMKQFTGTAPLDQSIVSRGISAGAHKASELIQGSLVPGARRPLLTPGAVEGLVEDFMGFGMTSMGAAAKVPLERALKRLDEAKTPAQRRVAEDLVREAETPSAAPLSTKELIEQNAGVTTKAQIAERSAALRKDIEKRAKANASIWEELQARAEQPAAQALWRSGDVDYPVTVTGQAMRGPDGELYTPVRYNGQDSFVPAKELSAAPEKAPTATVVAEEAPAGKTFIPDLVRIGEVPEPLQTGLGKLKKGNGWDLTAEERIALRDAARKAPPVEVLEQTVRERSRVDPKTGTRTWEKGVVDPELLAYTAAGTALGLAGLKLYRQWEDARAREADEQEFIRQPQENPEDLNPDRLKNRQFTEATEPGMTAKGAAVAMGAAALPFLGKGASVPSLMGMAGAVKGLGGSWHEGAVKKLSESISEPLIRNHPIPETVKGDAVARELQWQKEIKPYTTNAERMIRNYLNKYAGTERDPLAKIEVPFREGTASWESLMDKTLYSKAAKEYHAIDDLLESSGVMQSLRDLGGGKGGFDASKIPAEELIWHFGPDTRIRPGELVEGRADATRARAREANSAKEAIQSYLSHVADYLREHVSPEKLGQYDLVRAVKETAAWDKELAKKMADARKAEKEISPIYREYPDGMYWQKLTKPGQFARESDAMGHSVRGYEPQQYIKKDAVLHEGKETFLNPDWIPESGNTGHPSYGHGGWDAIKSGEAEVYSLRDAKGESHATVEIKSGQPAQEWMTTGSSPVKQRVGEVLPRISQIKGKQNRAPAERYLPYIQDFVKGEKWGEVEDLGNTGLVDLSAVGGEYAAAAAKATGHRYISHAEFDKFKPDFEPFTDPEYAARIARANRGQLGSADPALIGTLAVGAGASALGAYIDSDKPLRGAALGALGAAGFGALAKAGAGKGLDHALGAISTRLGNIDPSIKLAARDYERKVLQRTDAALDEVDPFIRGKAKLPAAQQAELDSALLANDTSRVAAAIKGNAPMVDAWRQVQNLLRKYEGELQALGRFREGLVGYFPRIVADLPGLKEALGASAAKGLEAVLAKAEKKMLDSQKRTLTDVETSLIINNWLKAGEANHDIPGYAHGRRVKEMAKELEPFYMKPTDSLLRFVSAASQDIETAKFFGRDLAVTKKGGMSGTDIDGSIGNYLGRLESEGRLTHDQSREVRSILKSRFEGGEQQMQGWAQEVRNATNIGLLGSFHSAATQIGDSVMTVYHHGLVPTLEALKDKLTGDSQISTKDLGLTNHIAEELGAQRASGKALQAIFKYGGFAAIDQFAKGLNLNAGLRKNQALARTEKGQAVLGERYAQAFGDDFPRLIEDLKAGRKSDLVDSLTFSELSDAQPISKMEMPQAYLEHPNGRLLYQMKTYMLKQMDVIRRDAYQEIANGHWARGAKNLVAVATALSLSNIPGDVVKAWLSGRPIDLSKISYVESLARNFGLSRYTTDKIAESKTPGKVVVGAAANMVKPPALSVAERIGAGMTQPEQLLPLIPGAGKTIYDRFGGGNEKAAAIERKQDRLDARDRLEKAEPWRKQERLERRRLREEKRAQQ